MGNISGLDVPGGGALPGSAAVVYYSHGDCFSMGKRGDVEPQGMSAQDSRNSN